MNCPVEAELLTEPTNKNQESSQHKQLVDSNTRLDLPLHKHELTEYIKKPWRQIITRNKVHLFDRTVPTKLLHTAAAMFTNDHNIGLTLLEDTDSITTRPRHADNLHQGGTRKAPDL